MKTSIYPEVALFTPFAPWMSKLRKPALRWLAALLPKERIPNPLLRKQTNGMGLEKIEIMLSQDIFYRRDGALPREPEGQQESLFS